MTTAGMLYTTILIVPKHTCHYLSILSKCNVAGQEISVCLKCADYIGNIDSDSHINVHAMAYVSETSQRFIYQEPHWIEKPHIEIKVLDR